MNYGELFERNKLWCAELNSCNDEFGYFYKVLPVDKYYRNIFMRELLSSQEPLEIECSDYEGRETVIVKIVSMFPKGVGRYVLEDVDLS